MGSAGRLGLLSSPMAICWVITVPFRKAIMSPAHTDTTKLHLLMDAVWLLWALKLATAPFLDQQSNVNHSVGMILVSGFPYPPFSFQLTLAHLMCGHMRLLIDFGPEVIIHCIS